MTNSSSELLALAMQFIQRIGRIQKAQRLPPDELSRFRGPYEQIVGEARDLWTQLFEASINAGFLGGAQTNESFAAKHRQFLQDGLDAIEHGGSLTCFAEILRKCRNDKRDELCDLGGYENISGFRAWTQIFKEMEETT